MKSIIALVRKDILVFLNDRVSVGLTFFVPMVLITIFGTAFSGGGSGPSGIHLIIVDEAQSETSSKLVEAFKNEGSFTVVTKYRVSEDTFESFDRSVARDWLASRSDTFRYVLVLPEDLFGEVFGLNLDFLYNPRNQIENQMVQGLLRKVIFSEGFPLMLSHMESVVNEEFGEGHLDTFHESLAGLIAENFGGDPDEILEQMEGGMFGFSAFPGTGEGATTEEGQTETADGDFLGQIVNIDDEQVFGKGKNPAAQSVGGWAVMFLLFSMTGAASSLFVERRAGIFQRLMSGPVTRQHILWSKYLFCGGLGLVQMIALIIFGEVFFGIIEDLRQIPPLFVVAAATAAASTAFGMLLASLSRTEAQANGLGTLFILSMSALGGAMFPLFLMPAIIQDVVAKGTLVYWAMDGILAVLWEDAGFSGIWVQTVVLLAIAGIIMIIANRRFERGDLFR